MKRSLTAETEQMSKRTDPNPDQEEDAPAGFWGKLFLTATPFAAVILLFLLDRCIRGG